MAIREKGKEDYFLHTTVKFGDSVVEKVPCKVYLPYKITDPVSLHLHPTFDQVRILEQMFEFSIYGEIEHPSGAVTIIRADKVYLMGMKGKHWGRELTEYQLTGKPIDLKVMHLRSRDTSPISNEVHGTFWLTPNKLLSPGQIIGRHFNGRVTVETGRWKHTFTLKNGLRIAFKRHYVYWESEEGDDVTSSELVAVYKLKGINNVTEMDSNILSQLDDLLLLVSFASRKRCTCLQWNVSNAEGYSIKYYRRDIGIPEARQGNDDELIGFVDFKKFLRTAYRNFNKVEP
ncbi:MAG: hypothetical protein M3247_04420, partial [Thermoproteota archaeon]|nr:hypothetical protein [Acidobacteriota bacterium]MDQ3902887.1 hypothetical protein [Thermoproteota archaeon]